jgi:hypothetical protein
MLTPHRSYIQDIYGIFYPPTSSFFKPRENPRFPNLELTVFFAIHFWLALFYPLLNIQTVQIINGHFDYAENVGVFSLIMKMGIFSKTLPIGI